MYLIGGAMAGLLLCGAAQAQSIYSSSETVTVPGSRFHDNDTISQRVSYADLNLSRTRDFQRLEVRIERTASRICDMVKGTDRWNLDQKMTCVNGAVHGAMAQVRPLRFHRVAYVAPMNPGPTFDD
jgi:UrcA family protein